MVRSHTLMVALIPLLGSRQGNVRRFIGYNFLGDTETTDYDNILYGAGAVSMPLQSSWLFAASSIWNSQHADRHGERSEGKRNQWSRLRVHFGQGVQNVSRGSDSLAASLPSRAFPIAARSGGWEC